MQMNSLLGHEPDQVWVRALTNIRQRMKKFRRFWQRKYQTFDSLADGFLRVREVSEVQIEKDELMKKSKLVRNL